MISMYQRSSNIYAGIYSLYHLWGTWSGYESTQWIAPPTAPPEKPPCQPVKKGQCPWIPHTSALIFTLFLNLKFYLMVYTSNGEKGIGSFNVIKS